MRKLSEQTNDIYLKAHYQILEDENVDKELKLFIALELLHYEELKGSLHGIQELFEEWGIFSKHWICLDAECTEIFEQLYKSHFPTS